MPMKLSEEANSRRIEPWMGWIALLLLLGACFWILRPFLTALMWAMILAYSLYPLQRLFVRWFRGSRILAACLVTLTVAVVFAGPVVLIGVSLAQDGKALAVATRDWFMSAPEEPPTWVSRMPVLGDELDGYWRSFSDDRMRWIEQIDQAIRARGVDDEKDGAAGAGVPRLPSSDENLERSLGTELSTGSGEESPRMVVMIGRFLVWAKSGLIAAGLAVGQGVTQVLLSAFLAFFLLRDAPELSQRLAIALERLAGQRGQHLIKVAGDTVRGVIFGILGTALAQALVAWLGFWLAGVPGAVLLSVLTFFFAVIPFRPPLIWLPAAFWLFAHVQAGWGIFLL
ncbi:MAG: AI-2E family transporter, partial [Luteolibacter sp.]